MKNNLITKLLGIILVSFILSACTPTTSEYYTTVETDEKVIGMPASNKYVSKGLKKLFRDNGWKVLVLDTGSIKTTGESGETVNIDSEYKSKTRYFVSLSQNWSDWCGPKNDMVSFDLTIIDSKSGEEAFVATGDDCMKTIISDLEEQLSPFWK